MHIAAIAEYALDLMILWHLATQNEDALDLGAQENCEVRKLLDFGHA